MGRARSVFHSFDKELEANSEGSFNGSKGDTKKQRKHLRNAREENPFAASAIAVGVSFGTESDRNKISFSAVRVSDMISLLGPTANTHQRTSH